MTTDPLDSQIKKAQLTKTELEIKDLKRVWTLWMKSVPAVAIAVTLLGLLLQQGSEARKREQEQYQRDLNTLASTSAAARVAAVLSLARFATQSRSNEVGSLLVNQLSVEADRADADFNEAVIDALLITLPKFEITNNLPRLLAVNVREVLGLSRAAGEYMTKSKAATPEAGPDRVLNTIGQRIGLTGLPFEERRQYRYVPVRIWELLDTQRYGNFVTSSLVSGKAKQNPAEADPLTVFTAEARRRLGQIWINSLAICDMLRAHKDELPGLSLAQVRLIAPDFHDLDLTGVDFKDAVLIAPNLQGATLNKERVVIFPPEATKEGR